MWCIISSFLGVCPLFKKALVQRDLVCLTKNGLWTKRLTWLNWRSRWPDWSDQRSCLGCSKAKWKLTESSLCRLETSSRKSLKLTLGSVAGPGKCGSGESSCQLTSGEAWGNVCTYNQGTHLVCRCVIILSYWVNPVQETAKWDKKYV